MKNLGTQIAKEFLLEMLAEESDAAKEAKKKGLTYAKFGRWADKGGSVVAKTEKGKLVPFSGKETEPKSASKSVDKTAPERKDGESKKSKIKTLVGVYSGRFQPFGRHHFAAYKQLAAVTGPNTYIGTSNVTDSKKSPFTFQEKKTIISKYGIPSSHVVQVRNPYAPEEILKKYDAKSTALVVIFGAKDAGRLGQGKYFLPYSSNAGKLEGYKEHGYYIIAEHVSVKVQGKELSGTEMRNLLADTSTSREEKAKTFKEIFGWYDKGIFDMVTDRLEANLKELVKMKKRLTEGKGFIIVEGGAYGHMSHPFDDQSLTFGDFKNIIRLSLQGQLDKETRVVEKLDGQALSISWVDGKLVAARNKSHIKNYGAGALDAKGLRQMFAGRGAIEDSFGKAIDDLDSAISSLSDKQKFKVFENGKNFMALEVIYPKTQNVIPYDINTLVFHGIITYDESGNPIGENKDYARMLAGMVRQANADVQKTFKIQSPSFVAVPPVQDFSKRQKYFLAKVDRLKNQFKLKDTDTVALYHQSWWENFISKKAKEMGYGLPNNILYSLVKRWAFSDKSNKVIDIVSSIKFPQFAEWVKTFDKENHDQQIKTNMLPFETLFLELGTEVLKNASGFLAANPEKSVQSVRKSVNAAIKQLSGSHDISKIDKLKSELNRIQQIGGFEKIVPVEGLVFMYGGKSYKLTGAFAPVNQILGMLKFGK